MNSNSFRILRWTLGLLCCAASFTAEPDRVPGRLLVGLRDPAAAARTLAAHRLSVRHELGALSIASVEAPPEAAESLRRSGAFTYVEPDYYAHTAADPNDPSYLSQWHLRRIGGPLAWGLSTGSESVIVAVLDSG